MRRIEIPEATQRPAFDPIESYELIVSGCEERGPQIRVGGNAACYAPMTDTVRVPTPEQFRLREAFYGTLFHELSHSTGHPSRLGRFPTDCTDTAFGSPAYSREELVSEMSAAFLCAEAGISPPVLDEQASYIAGWLSKLRNDPRAIVVAAGQAQKAADLVLGVTAPKEQPAE